MKKSEYRQRRERIIEMFDPKQFHHFETKLGAVNAQFTHLSILNNLYQRSRRNRGIWEVVMDWVRGE